MRFGYETTVDSELATMQQKCCILSLDIYGQPWGGEEVVQDAVAAPKISLPPVRKVNMRYKERLLLFFPIYPPPRLDI